MPAAERVTRSSFSQPVLPVSIPRPLSVLPDRTWSDKDWQRIQLGYRSRGMDEKWDVFTEGDVVFLHRSWTGRGIYEATFTPADAGGRRIAGAVVERDPERYRLTDDEYDCLMLELVVSGLVLGEPVRELRARWLELARAIPGGTEAPAVAVQHSALGLRPDS